MIKRITSSKGIVTAVWVLGLVVIWEICAFIVGATQRTPVNVLPHLCLLYTSDAADEL